MFRQMVELYDLTFMFHRDTILSNRGQKDFLEYIFSRRTSEISGQWKTISFPGSRGTISKWLLYQRRFLLRGRR